MPLIKKIPLPMAGLSLALAATGNLLVSYGQGYRWGFGVLSWTLLLALILKVVLDPTSVRQGFSNPLIASVMPTFSMSLLLLSGYVAGVSPAVGEGLWFLGGLLHVTLIVLFTRHHLMGRKTEAYLPSYFVVYVGIVVASVTAPVFDQWALGQAAFWFGLVSFFALLPHVLNRVFVLRDLPEPAQPAIMILAAPASLLLTGYLKSFPEPSLITAGLLALISGIMLLLALSFLPRLLRLKYYPSYAAFTFPLVISAVGVKSLNGVLTTMGFGAGYLVPVVKLLEAGAVSIVLYVLLRFIQSLSIREASARVSPQ
ncbi:TDT family transporter [Acidaminobacter hydrogenoformans]|uniref:Exfoliative toxin A/B n=1 Tax=Acidaminobacter hydrogenoformans DSM 2784 TaxID=1120920 RepID=A0A1G5RXM5_9FIRM|nr:TDT family transporter [Acidaminobacter hydrogenoformans]SCZ78756.1 exfoliative toxin A/B [Acidaminobacter hydrogenoformans DSM 2784]